MPRGRANTEADFWALSIPEPMSGCWLWMGYYFDTGYGAFAFNHKQRSAHRLAWEFTHGAIPDGLRALHRCDNRACANPAHLYLGTHADNMRDMTARKRAAVGARHMSRTKPESVPRGECHWMKAHPEMVPRGERHWTRRKVGRLPRGDAHYLRQHPERVAGERNPAARLTEADVRAARIAYRNKTKTIRQLAQEHGVAKATIHHAITGWNWGHIND